MTPADEGDVIFVVELSDVRESPTLADYTGELEAKVGLRITDALNGPETTQAELSPTRRCGRQSLAP